MVIFLTNTERKMNINLKNMIFLKRFSQNDESGFKETSEGESGAILDDFSDLR